MTTRYLVVPLLLALLALPSAAVDVDKYIKDLSAPDASVRWTAASTLGSLGDTVAVDSLMTSLRDESFKVRQAAAWSLGELGDAKAVSMAFTGLHPWFFIISDARRRQK
jgi:HEAT repeat protein